VFNSEQWLPVKKKGSSRFLAEIDTPILLFWVAKVDFLFNEPY
jgi:hypothetical protein